MSGCIASLTASFCSIYPQYLLFSSFSILFWWIKLSRYQHRCCTVSLIASFCSINPQHLPFLSIFLHDFPVICQFEFVCNPNGMTAEPKSHGCPTKPLFGFAGRPWDFGSAVIPLGIQNGEIWIETVNVGDLWSRMKRSKTQCNIRAGKEII